MENENTILIRDLAFLDKLKETAEFVKEKVKDKWKDSLERSAINVTVESKYKGKPVKVDTMFIYDNDEENNVTYTGRTDLGKFANLYKGLPSIGKPVTLIANEKGYWKLMIKI